MPLDGAAIHLESGAGDVRYGRITAFWGWLKKRVIRQVLREDSRIYPALHRGLKASPFQGTIRIHEELVFAFQDYLRREAPERKA